MALCPFAEHKLIPAGSSDPVIRARVAILHTDGGNATTLYPYFRDRSGGIESHFFIRKDGHIEQYRDTNYQADANYLANDFAISIETQGTGYEDWTPEQIESILKLLRWLGAVEDIPMRKVDRWDGSGVGYHIQFGSPGKWTNVSKICPGPKRIEQYNKVILPALESGATGVEDEVSAAEVWNYRFGDSKDDPSARAVLSQARANAVDARQAANANARALRDMDANQERLEKAVAALAQRLEEVAPGVAQDVVEALGDRIHITVEVKEPTA